MKSSLAVVSCRVSQLGVRENAPVVDVVTTGGGSGGGGSGNRGGGAGRAPTGVVPDGGGGNLRAQSSFWRSAMRDSKLL